MGATWRSAARSRPALDAGLRGDDTWQGLLL